jgi:methyl-accepting chemotaxis protein
MERGTLTRRNAIRDVSAVKFRRSAPALLISAFSVAVLALTGVAMLLTSSMLANAESDSFRLMQDVLKNSLRSAEERALVRAELVSSMPAVRAAFQARDRERLLAECRDMFKEQSEKYGLDQAQFHVYPGTSFLRLHNPEDFGDDQTSYRPMLAEVHRERVLRKGAAITLAGPVITGIVPMSDDHNQHVGSFEMGLEFAPMLERIKTAYRLEVAAFIDERLLREIAKDLPGEHLSPQNRVGKYIRYHATHPELMKALVTDREIQVSEPVSYERSVAGSPWGVQLVPMYNYANKQIGVYALSMDFSDTRSLQGRSRVWQGLGALFAVVLLAGFTLIVVRGVLLAPLGALNARFAALAEGDASQPAEPASSYCGELRELADSYEKLRAPRGE